MPLHANFLSVVRFSGSEFSSLPWAGRLSVQDAPALSPAYTRFESDEVEGDLGLRRDHRAPIFEGASPSDPQAFMPPTSGVAANGLPIYSWDQAAAQITRDSNGWAGLGNAATVTYGFRDSAILMPNGTSGFVQFSAAQIAVAEVSLALWSRWRT